METISKAETAKLLTLIAAMYPKFEITDLKVNLWFDMLNDLPFNLAQTALKKVMLTSQFPPTVADIRKAVADMTSRDADDDVSKAWGEVNRALHKWGLAEPEKAFSLMSPLTQTIVKRIGWTEICTTDKLSVIRGQFMSMYEVVKQRKEFNDMLPQNFRLQIEKTKQAFKVLGGSDGSQESKNNIRTDSGRMLDKSKTV